MSVIHHVKNLHKLIIIMDKNNLTGKENNQEHGNAKQISYSPLLLSPKHQLQILLAPIIKTCNKIIETTPQAHDKNKNLQIKNPQQIIRIINFLDATKRKNHDDTTREELIQKLDKQATYYIKILSQHLGYGKYTQSICPKHPNEEIIKKLTPVKKQVKYFCAKCGKNYDEKEYTRQIIIAIKSYMKPKEIYIRIPQLRQLYTRAQIRKIRRHGRMFIKEKGYDLGLVNQILLKKKSCLEEK